MFTTRDFLRQHPETVAGFVRASLKGWRDYLNDPTAAHTMIAKLNPALNRGVDAVYLARPCAMADSLPATTPSGAQLGQMTSERWTTMYKQLYDLKVIDKAFDPATAYTLRFNEKELSKTTRSSALCAALWQNATCLRPILTVFFCILPSLLLPRPCRPTRSSNWLTIFTRNSSKFSPASRLARRRRSPRPPRLASSRRIPRSDIFVGGATPEEGEPRGPLSRHRRPQAAPASRPHRCGRSQSARTGARTHSSSSKRTATFTGAEPATTRRRPPSGSPI